MQIQKKIVAAMGAYSESTAAEKNAIFAKEQRNTNKEN